MLNNNQPTPLTSVVHNTKVFLMLHVYLGFIVALFHVILSLGPKMIKQILEQL